MLTSVGCSNRTDPKEKESETSNDKATLAQSAKDYRLVADDLYMDKKGIIYHRTIDVSAADANHHAERGVYAYRSSVFVDTIIDGENTFIIAPMYRRIDTLTFQRKEHREEYPNYVFYEDANYHYFYIEVSDGGTLRATKK
ncbi:MAG: hypothetical protein Crog3KO_08160 [Crocinitomicaceae bacterium]